MKIEGKPATHFAEGNIEYWYCDGCKKYYSDENCVYEISYELTILPMIEHAPDGTGWHFDANSHWQTCECGAKLDMAAHNFSWVIDSEATTTEPGSKHEECTMCGYEKASVEIPATGAGDGEAPAKVVVMRQMMRHLTVLHQGTKCLMRAHLLTVRLTATIPM